MADPTLVSPGQFADDPVGPPPGSGNTTGGGLNYIKQHKLISAGIASGLIVIVYLVWRKESGASKSGSSSSTGVTNPTSYTLAPGEVLTSSDNEPSPVTPTPVADEPYSSEKFEGSGWNDGGHDPVIALSGTAYDIIPTAQETAAQIKAGQTVYDQPTKGTFQPYAKGGKKIANVLPGTPSFLSTNGEPAPGGDKKPPVKKTPPVKKKPPPLPKDPNR